MANFVDAGGVEFTINADGSQSYRELDKVKNKTASAGGAMVKNMDKSQKGLKGVFAKIGAGVAMMVAGIVAGLTAMAVKIGQVLKKAVKLGSDFNENSSKMLTVFKNMRKEASATAKSLTDYGFSLGDATKTIADIGDVLTGVDFGQEEALAMSDQIARLAQDMVSFTNYAGGVSGATQVLTKAMLGERDALIGLGVKLTETSLKRRKGWKEADMQGKAEITLQAIMEQSKNAMGDYGRTQDSFANRMRKIKAITSDLQTTLGKGFITGIEPLIHNLTIVIDEMGDMEKLGWAFGKSLAVAGQALIVMLQSFRTIGSEYNKFINKGNDFLLGRDKRLKKLGKSQKENKKIQKAIYGDMAKDIKIIQDLEKKGLKNLSAREKQTLEWKKESHKISIESLKVVNNALNGIYDKTAKEEERLGRTRDNNTAKLQTQLDKLKEMSEMKFEPKKIDTSKHINKIKQVTDETTKSKKEVSKIVDEWDRVNAQIDYGHKSLAEGLPLLKILHQLDKDRADALKGKVKLTEEDLKLMAKVKSEQERINELQQTVANNIIPQIVDKTGGLIGDVNNLSKAIGGGDPTSIAGAWITVLDTVSQLAFQMYEILETTGDWGEAMETTLTGIIEQVPIMGRWVAEAIDKLWETDTEKREKALKDISKAEAKFQHDVAMRRVESTQKQIDHYEKHLTQLQNAKADETEIWAIEEKIVALREKQTVELERQRKIIRDNLRLEGDFRIIAEENIKAGVEWLEKQEVKEQSELDRLKNQQAQYEQDAIKIQVQANKWAAEYSALSYSREGGLGGKETARQKDLARWIAYAREERERSEQSAENMNKYIEEQQKLLEGVTNELANYGDEMVRLEIQQFKHRKAMGETTIAEELAFYEMILEKMRERNTEIEADIQKLLSQGYEFTHADIQALQEQLFSLGEIYSTEEQILKLNEDLTAEMEKQAGLAGGLTDQQKAMVDQLKQQIELGILDVANIADVGAITGLMQGMGLAGMNLLSQMQGIGVSGLTAQQVQNLNLVINNTQATPDMMGKQAADVIGRRVFG